MGLDGITRINKINLTRDEMIRFYESSTYPMKS